MVYSLYPGLKRILEDKRIKNLGIPEELSERFLMAEQFVIDCRNLTLEDLKNMKETYDDLTEMGLNGMPYNDVIIHNISEFKGQTYVFSIFSSDKKTHLMLEDWKDLDLFEKILESGSGSFYEHEEKPSKQWADEMEREDIETALRSWAPCSELQLVVMLATKNAVKDRHLVKKSQQPINGKPHKKGSGGYTIIRSPEPHEVGDKILSGWTVRPHFRRGHIRRLHPEDKTRWVFVSPCFVNGDPEISRKAYLVK